jgi:opacity protein-like surface antigen
MNRRRIIAATLAVTAAVAASAAAAPADVTFRMECCYRFSGSIPSSAAGEYVAIEAKKCGQDSWISTFGASTQAGGTYYAVTNSPPDYRNLTIYPPAEYRARWRDSFSERVMIRSDVIVRMKKLRHLRYRATIQTSTVGGPNLRGRSAELQRLAGQWKRIGAARFVVAERDSFITTYTATFRVPARATLRIAVPKETVAPCYNAAVSKTWRT